LGEARVAERHLETQYRLQLLLDRIEVGGHQADLFQAQQ
jgi:hypothetical protein